MNKIVIFVKPNIGSRIIEWDVTFVALLLDQQGLSATQIARFIREQEDANQVVTREKLRANPFASKTPMNLPIDHIVPEKAPHHPFLEIPENGSKRYCKAKNWTLPLCQWSSFELDKITILGGDGDGNQ